MVDHRKKTKKAKTTHAFFGRQDFDICWLARTSNQSVRFLLIAQKVIFYKTKYSDPTIFELVVTNDFLQCNSVCLK